MNCHAFSRPRQLLGVRRVSWRAHAALVFIALQNEPKRFDRFHFLCIDYWNQAMFYQAKENENMFRFRPLVVIALLVSGCAGTPGNVSSTESKLDGEKQVHVEPGWLYAGGMKMPEMKLGGFWSDKHPNDFDLDVAVVGVDGVTGLKIGIDGEISEFGPSEKFTSFKETGGTGPNSVLYVPNHPESEKHFVIPLEYVKQMVAGRKVIVQVHLDSIVKEGEFSFNQQSYAKPAFRKALAIIEKSN